MGEEYMGGGDLARLDWLVREEIKAKARLGVAAQLRDADEKRRPPGPVAKSREDGFQVKPGMTETGPGGPGGEADNMGRTIVKCKECGQEAENFGRGYCRLCYQRMRAQEKREAKAAAGESAPPRGGKLVGNCLTCGRFGPIEAKGLCKSCYQKHRRATKKAGGIEPPIVRSNRWPETLDGRIAEAQAKTLPGVIVVDFSRAEDQKLLEDLKIQAAKNRRSVDQHAAMIIEQHLTALGEWSAILGTPLEMKTLTDWAAMSAPPRLMGKFGCDGRYRGPGRKPSVNDLEVVPAEQGPDSQSGESGPDYAESDGGAVGADRDETVAVIWLAWLLSRTEPEETEE